MINANELRLGNLVLDKFHQIVAIKEIRPNSSDAIGQLYDYIIYFPDQEGRSILHNKDTKPIPLTPEILKKVGFYSFKTSYSTIYSKLDFNIEVSKNSITQVVEYNSGSDTQEGIYSTDYLEVGEPLLYLHQLQNRFHSFTNKELEINLTPSIQERC